MDKNYGLRLVRYALADPSSLATAEKFWKIEFLPFYLRRAEQLIWHEPERALPFLKPAPVFATRLAETNPTANGADFMILGHSYLGNAYRRLGHSQQAEDEFQKARAYRDSASPKTLARHLQFYAKLCAAQHRPEAFDMINEAIAIHKRGNLVHRHYLGECLVLRGIAYYHFEQQDKILADFTAALNHLSIGHDPMAYYCALHNLAAYAVLYGSEEELVEAIGNLKPARTLLGAQKRHNYAKSSMRWLFALLDFRLGKYGSAELALSEISASFYRRKLPFETGLVQLDLARLYLRQGRRDELRQLVRDTAMMFRELGNEAKAGKALELWRLAFQQKVTDEHLLTTRRIFFAEKEPFAHLKAA